MITKSEPSAQIEPDAWRDDFVTVDPNRIQLSQAISLKRIADALDRLVGQNPLLRPDGKPNSIMDIARQGE